jgi:urease accessory protein
MGNAAWTLWQLADSAFPAGGMNHSGGLEAVWQAGEIAGGDELRAFARSHLVQQGSATAPFVAAVVRDVARFAELDRRCDAVLVNHVANRASRAQGRALLSAARNAFPLEMARPIRRDDSLGELPVHHATAFGVVGSALSVEPVTLVRLFLFTTTRGVVSAAVRVGIVGPFEGQAVQHELSPLAERVVVRAAGTDVDDACATAPLADVAQGCQDRLYSRLFVS